METNSEKRVSEDHGGVISFFDPGGIPAALAVLLTAVLVARFAYRSVQVLSERFPGRRLLIKQSGTLLSFAIYGMASLAVFGLLFDLSTQTLFALSGGAAVTVGFALKDVASSFLASITILVSKPFQVGDRVAFEGYYGEVTEIGLRSVRLTTLDDNQVTIPSNKFLTDAVANANAGALDCMVVTPFFLAADADMTRAKDIVNEAILASRYLFLGKPFTVVGSMAMGAHGNAYVQLQAKAYVFDARYEKAFATDLTELVLAAFQREGIPMPVSNLKDRIGS